MQEQRQVIHCPICNKPICKVSGVSVGCEIETVCKACKEETKVMCRLTQDGWEKYQKYE